MSKTDELVYFYPEGHRAHFEAGHPERPERVESIVNALKSAGWWDDVARVSPLGLPENVLNSVHQPAYLSLLEMACKRAGHLDADTYVLPASWQLALNAAGGASALAREVWLGKARRGLALTRPPGHHATRGQGMGFCLLNNVAIAAEYLIQVEAAQRLAIVDLDLHHGNGTEDIFWQRKDVFFLSTHQSPLYPGSGNAQDRGGGEGFGYTANFPLPPGSGDQAFLQIMDEIILPLLDRYQPQMILVSFGFDTHWRDPLGSLLLSAQVYGELIQRLTTCADQHCGGKIAMFLEGGYDLEAAKACSQAVVAAMAGLHWEDPLGPSPFPEGKEWRRIFEWAKQTWEL